MKVSILQENLLEGLNAVMGALNNRPSLPILSNVLLRAEDGRLTIAVTNLELGVEAHVGAKVDEDGSITVPAKTFKDLIATLPPERVDLVLNEKTQTLKITCASTSTNLKGMSADEYPPLGVDGFNEVTTIPASAFRELVNHTVFAAAKDDSRPNLTGISVKVTDSKIVLAAADGYRLARRSLETDTFGADIALIIPARTMAEASRVIKEDDAVTLMVLPDCSRVAFQIGATTMYSQTIDGQYPNVEQIIPKSHKTSAVIHTQELLRACKRAEIFARSANLTMTLNLKPGESDLVPGTLTVSAQSQEQGDNEGRLDAKIAGDVFEASLNVQYLMQLLGAVKEDQVVIETSASNAPIIVRPVGREDFDHVIMPMSKLRS